MSQSQLDAFAGLLAEMMEVGRVPCSRVSARARRDLAPLYAANALREERSGAGQAVIVDKPEVLARYVARKYPNGLTVTTQDGFGPRTASVHGYADTKAGGGLDREVVVLRAFGDTTISFRGNVINVGALTRQLGCAAFVLDEVDYPVLVGIVAVVENPEFFFDFERSGVVADTAILASGRMSARLIGWLASNALAQAQILHCGDYDPVGLAEYVRLKRAAGERARLYLPDNLETLFARYRNPSLVENSPAIKHKLGTSNDPDVLYVLELIKRFDGGLEQEALLTCD